MSKLVTAVCLTLILVWEVICLYWFYVVSDRILFSENSNEVIWHLLFVVLTMPNYMATCFLYWSAVGIHGEIQRNSRLLTVTTGFGAREQVPRTEVDMVKLAAPSPFRDVWHVILLRRDNGRPVRLAMFFVLPGFGEHKRSVAAENFATTVGEWLDCPVMRD
jgi:hypothetical protein